jgi:hypothetical protein
MYRRLTVVSLSAICMAWAAAPASASTVIGPTYQTDTQGANSGQSGINGTGLCGCDTSVIGDSTPTLLQGSDNVVGNQQALAGGDSTLIANGSGAAFGQSDSGAVNSQQTGVNGDSGQGLGQTLATLDQESTNVVVGTELLAAAGPTIVIGADSQVNNGAVNSSQSGANFPGGGFGLLEQDSANILASLVVLGG